MSGYTLNQLLAWCHDDRLIDMYAIRGDMVYVRSGDSMKKLDSSGAINYLKTLIRERTDDAGEAETRRRMRA